MFVKQGYSLRKMEKSDLAMVLAWRNQPLVRENMYTDHVISPDEHARWFEGIHSRTDMLHFVCEYQGKPFGIINFVGIDPRNGKALWGFYLGDTKSPGRGAAMEFLAIEYAFTVLKLRKLCCEVFAFNEPVIKMHLKFGFQQEGLYHAHVMKSGHPEDVAALALFSHDWANIRPRMEKICFRKAHFS
jgi:UDP-4-amino-4,6-dideoxy-N-acetyl-beta-L-altrosamine N-acetyltransferase